MSQTYPDDPDGQTLQQIATDGSDMSKPMDIDFHVAAPSEATARQVADQAARLGYDAAIFFDDEEPGLEEDLPPWTCECTRTMVPGYDAIVAAQEELDAIARPLGAYVDGWGSFGNADESESPP